MPFELPYVFKQSDKVIVMETKQGKFLRVNPKDDGEINKEGGKGQFAQWTVELDGDIAMFKNNKTGKYLRIVDAEKIDVKGVGGKFCKFEVVKGQGAPNKAKLKAVDQGKFLHVRDEFVGTGIGKKDDSILTFYRDE